MYKLEADYWWHRGKRQLVARLLRRFLRMGSNGRPRLLIPGVGTGYLHAELQGLHEVVGLDVSTESLAFCRTRKCRDLACSDLEEGLPFRNGTFDALLVLDVLEHVQHEAQLLGECLRVLKAGGYLVVSVPAFPFLWSSWDEMLNHRRRYHLGDLIACLRRQGFEVAYGNYFNLLAFGPAVLTRVFRKLTKVRISEFFPIPRLVNESLARAFGLDTGLALSFRLPFGLSCAAVGRRPV